eukprot:TRINITY_DN3668_c1_g1_i1.p1 TRINITY_DN3668_c1_g1~~TRINITY_DN3668_c1_g1_i1.p1  ORF type:complete len:422 (-),score=77.09 TRINITY_DN3668_c1_g1_i1:159-1424(-)
MHRAALIKEDLHDSASFGWNSNPEAAKIDWSKLVESTQLHIKSLNFGYKGQLHSNNVQYLNELASLKDANTVITKNRRGEIKERTAKNILVAVGGRPVIPSFPGSEYVLSSDDLFSLSTPPGRTLVIGASYIALECAGFLHAFGFPTTVMVRSILLRGFDQQMANLIHKNMENSGLRFIMKAIPTSIENKDDGLHVTYKTEEGDVVEVFDTVFAAIGRYPDTKSLNLEAAGVVTAKSGKIIVDDFDRSNVSNVFSIGDCSEGRPELTPSAIRAGKLLAHRLFANKTEIVDYKNIPTTVFSPLEYSTVGFSEEQAIAEYGEENIEVYHSFFQPLETTIPHRLENECYVKLICNKKDYERIIGIHLLCPNSGEIMQGLAVAVKCGATKKDFDGTVGIHPTMAEEIVLLKATKRGGEDPNKSGC